MKQMRTLDLVMPALVVLLIGFLLAPAVARLQRSPAEARCQSNMRQWARAMVLYLDDNHQRYPTNRNPQGFLTARVYLTPLSADGTMQVGQDGKPIRFANGVNWVEALYPYIWTSAEKTGQDWKSFRKCPNTSTKTDPPSSVPPPSASLSATMTYAFNLFLVEQPKGVIQNTANLMMLREMDRKINSCLRPTSPSIGSIQSISSTNPPENTFLVNAWDRALDQYIMNGKPNANQHDSGSYILFADGHVKWFGMSYMPASMAIADNWDANDSRWYNYNGTTTTVPVELRKTIAITP